MKTIIFVIMEDRRATSDALIEKMDLTTIMSSCRICMSRNVNMSELFEENIIEEILFCTGVCLRNKDGFPNKICTQCLKDLYVAYKFKTACILAEQTFHKLLVDASIKTEAAVSDPEYELTHEYEEDNVEPYEEKAHVEDEQATHLTIKEELDIVPVVQRRVNRRKRIKKEKNAIVTKPKRPGRPKTSKAPRRLKKFKFKKLHCEACDIKFDNKQQCDEHKKEKHKDSDNWVCEICGKLFIHRASHYTHIKSHLPPKFACDQCEYKTWHKHDLVKHIRIHTGIKMYQCEYCTASYYTSSNLTGHIRRHHMKQRNFECDICHMTFFDRTKLNRHVDSHNDVKRFECEVCHSCFTRRCYWKKHLLRQHDIVTPPQRPGRQKINAVVGEDLIDKVDIVLRPAQKTVQYINADEFQVQKLDKEV